ncbi:MAG TPA: hypothetical protein VF263_11840 [Longimicrobiaceae bacterium]
MISLLVGPLTRRLRSRPRGAVAGALALAALVVGCDGSNLFQPDPTQQLGADRALPTVTIELPTPGALLTPLDSVFTRVRVQDNRALKSLEISGFAVRGDPALGTQTTVARFVTKTVTLDSLSRVVKDTTVTRFLTAVRDTAQDRTVYIVATAKDTAGNVAADTVTIAIGGTRAAPTVDIQFPTPGTIVAPLDSVFTRVRVQGTRPLRLVQIAGYSLRGDPALGTQTVVPRFEPKTVRLDSLGRAVRDTTITRYLLSTRDSLPERTVYIVATAQDTSGAVSSDTVAIAIGGPRVQITSPAQDSTFRAGSLLTVRLSAEDRSDQVSAIRVRTSGAFARDTTLTLRTPGQRVDTVVVIPIPAGAQGDLQIDATAISLQRIEGTARPVRVRILPAAADNVAPRVSFTATVPARLEVTDTLTVTVNATDETRVDSIGATILAIRRGAVRDDTLGVLTQRVAVSPPTNQRTFRFTLDPLRLSGLDTLTVAFEVIAFAKDAAGNCATATTQNTVQSLPCRTGLAGSTVSDGPGATSNAAIVRGQTVLPPNAGDVIADLISDRTRVYASNKTRNRVEILPVGTTRFSGSVLVGSQPWGLALSRDTTTLLVANSGGAGSISRVPISAGGVGSEDTGRRIVTENVVLFVVRFTIDDAGRINLTITDRDYSDRPQFLAQTASGRIIYSTVPTASAPDGTVQDYNPNAAEPTTDLFVEYARGFVEDQFVVRRADVVSKFIRGSGSEATDQLVVCDHRPNQPRGSLCFPRRTSDTLSFQQIQDSLTANGSDAVLDFAVDPGAVGLSDTTFLAVSKDLRTIAVGEGQRVVGRVLAFGEDAAGNVAMVGNTRDLVNNASDRVIGLALNRDGTLGVARGQSTYFFRRDLRKLGDRVVTGTPTGGVALHPDHPGTNLAFVSGQDEAGRPFIDVVDTFHFQVVKRIYIRNPVTGTLIAVPASGAGGVVLKLYAITASGVVSIDLTQADLQ